MTTLRYIVCGALLAPLSAGAQIDSPAPRTLEVQAGLGGAYRVGGWVPVHVTLRADDRPLAGTLLVEGHGARVSRTIDLPSQSSNAVYLQFPARAAGGPMAVTLIDAGGATRARATLTLSAVDAAVPLIAVLDTRARTAPEAHDVPADGGGHLVRLAIDRAPQLWQGFSAADAILVETAAIDRIRPEQARALRHWTMLGGRLVVFGAPESMPGLMAGHAGAGSVALIRDATSLDARARAAGRGSLATAAALAGIDPAVRALAPTATSLSMLDRAGAQRNDAAGTWALGLLAGCYLLVLVAVSRHTPSGPNGARRYSLAMGGAAAVFCAWAMALGSLQAEAGVIEQRAALLHVFPSFTEAFVSEVSEIVSPARSLLLVVPVGPSAGIVPADEAPVDFIANPAGTIDAAIAMSLWSRRRFRAEGFIAAPFTLETTASATMRIHNHSRIDLIGCRRAGADAVVDIPAGASFDLSAAPAAPATRPLDRAQQALQRRVQLAWEGSDTAPLVCGAAGGVALLRAEALDWRQDGPVVVVFHLDEEARGEQGAPAP